MYAQNDNPVPSSRPSAATLTASAPWSSPTSENAPQPPARGMIMNPSRATLRTRPRIQRALIRSWEYIQPVRVTFLVIRLLVVLWLIVLSGILLSAGIGWGWTLLPAAVAVLALSVWVFTTAGKGWPVVDA
jgi:predicted anti-sigma-YlaC factor YlaD